ncbi:MAG TPA: hypothetical protein VGR45_05345, partial [Stellaceae bacterium]|nr:hypothetical protein [Stellaceae bacterium]
MGLGRTFLAAALIALPIAAKAQYTTAVTPPAGSNNNFVPTTVWVNGAIASATSFGAKCDVVDEPQDGSMTLGSPILTSASYSFPASAAGKSVVVMGAGGTPFYPTTVAHYTINAGGTGYANGDKSTMSDGTVLEIVDVSGGVVQSDGIAIWSSLGEATLPTQPLTQSSSTGSGTGLQVTLTFYGQPLAATIKSVAGNIAILSANSGNTVSTQRWWYGTDDKLALQKGLNALAPVGNLASLVLPAKCLTTQQLEIQAVQTGN